MTDDTIVPFTGLTVGDVPPDRVLKAAIGKMKLVIVTGVTEDGKEYYASSNSDMRDTIWMLERMKHTIMKAIEDED